MLGNDCHVYKQVGSMHGQASLHTQHNMLLRSDLYTCTLGETVVSTARSPKLLAITTCTVLVPVVGLTQTIDMECERPHSASHAVHHTPLPIQRKLPG